MDTELKQRIKNLLDKVGRDQQRGKAPDWKGWKNNAFALAAQAGHSFRTNCPNCDADCYDVLLELEK
jgi:hypothetical protein